MIKKRNSFIYAIVFFVQLCTPSLYGRSNGGLIAGAVGAVLLGVAGIAAAIDYFSETHEQLIARITHQYHSIGSQYGDAMQYFGQLVGVGVYSPYISIHSISESVLYEFATYVWNKNIAQSTYRSEVWSAKNTLEANKRDLTHHIYALEGKAKTYQDQQNLAKMRMLLSSIQSLLNDITLFVNCLEHHKSYFSLYDSAGTINNRYAQEQLLIKSEIVWEMVASEMIRYVKSRDGGRYALKNFIHSLESDISQLESKIYNLRYDYESGRRYAHSLIYNLTMIKNTIIAHPQYQQELYEYERERLHLQQVRMLEEQARLERDRINIMRRQNRILQEQNMIEQQRLLPQIGYLDTPEVLVDISVTI